MNQNIIPQSQVINTETLFNENQNLKFQINQLLLNCDNLYKQYMVSEFNNTNLNAKNYDLRNSLKNLENTIHELEITNKSLVATNNNLEDDINCLKATNEDLKLLNEKLGKKIDQNNNNSFSESEKTTLLEEIDVLQKKIEKMTLERKLEEAIFQKEAIFQEEEIYKTLNEFISSLCEIPSANKIINRVEISDLKLINKYEGSISTSKANHTKMTFSMKKKDYQVELTFENSIQEYLHREEYVESAPDSKIQKEELHLHVLLDELSKLGNGRKLEDKYTLTIDPIKAALYQTRKVSLYVGEEFHRNNRCLIDKIKSSDENENLIVFIEPANSKQIYNILLHQILNENDLIVVLDIDMLGDTYTEILNSLIELFEKKLDILIEGTLIKLTDFNSYNTTHILTKIKEVIEIKQNKIPTVLSAPEKVKKGANKVKKLKTSNEEKEDKKLDDIEEELINS